MAWLWHFGQLWWGPKETTVSYPGQLLSEQLHTKHPFFSSTPAFPGTWDLFQEFRNLKLILILLPWFHGNIPAPKIQWAAKHWVEIRTTDLLPILNTQPLWDFYTITILKTSNHVIEKKRSKQIFVVTKLLLPLLSDISSSGKEVWLRK